MDEWITVDTNKSNAICAMVMALCPTPGEGMATLMKVIIDLDQFNRKPEGNDLTIGEIVKEMLDSYTNNLPINDVEGHA